MREIAAAHYKPSQIEAFLTAATPAIDDLIDRGTVWLAWSEGRLVASAAWHFKGALPTLGRAALLDRQVAVFRSVYVRPAWTRRGLASRVMNRAEADARRRGATHARLHAMHGASEFYRRRGYMVVCDTVFDLAGTPFPGIAMMRTLTEATAQAA